MLGGNPERAGATTDGPRPPLKLLWKKEFREEPTSEGPVGEFYVQGDLLVMATSGGLLGLDASTGRERWRTVLKGSTGERPRVGGFGLGPNGLIYAMVQTPLEVRDQNDPRFDTDLVAFEAATGEELFRLASRPGSPYGGLGDVGAQSPCVVGDHVYIYAYRELPSAEDRTVANTRRGPLVVLLAVTVSREDRTFSYPAEWETPLTFASSFDASGSVAATTAPLPPMAPSGCVAVGGIVCDRAYGRVLGSVRWTWPASGQFVLTEDRVLWQSFREGLQLLKLPALAPAWVESGWPERLLEIRREYGARGMTGVVPESDYLPAQLLVDDGRIIASGGSFRPAAAAYDLSSGRVLWEQRFFGAYTFQALAVSPGLLYGAMRRGEEGESQSPLVISRLSDGLPIWLEPAPESGTWPLLRVTPGRLYAMSYTMNYASPAAETMASNTIRLRAWGHDARPLPSAVSWTGYLTDGRMKSGYVRRFPELVVNGRPVLRLRHAKEEGYASEAEMSLQQLVDHASDRLQQAFDQQARPQDFVLRTQEGDIGLWYRDTLIIAIDDQQAALNSTTPAVLARVWLANLREAMRHRA